MGFLEQFARKERISGNTKVVTARLPEGVYDDFKVRCDNLGLSINEAVYLLITNELKGNVYKTNTIQGEDEEQIIQNEENIIQSVFKKKLRVGKIISVDRFTVNHWKVGNRLPCPICGEWVVTSTFNGRHAKIKHNTTSEEIFTNGEYMEIADRMVIERMKAGE